MAMDRISYKHTRGTASMVMRQRPQFRRISRHPRLSSLLTERLLTAADAMLFGSSVLRSYREAVERDWDKIAPFMPDEVHSSLDIGCGIGGVNEFIYQNFSATNPVSITLADKDEVSKPLRYGMSENPSAYNSLSRSVDYLTSVGVPPDAINTVNLSATKLPENEKYDLIVSLISLGYHYPVSVYLDYLTEHLSESGVMILDCRLDSDGIESLGRHFDIKTIYEDIFMTRIACTIQ